MINKDSQERKYLSKLKTKIKKEQKSSIKVNLPPSPGQVWGTVPGG